jgi:hypothetical protein
MTVRTLLSDRAGAGKTLYVKNMMDKPENELRNKFKCGFKLSTLKTAKLSIDAQSNILGYLIDAPKEQVNCIISILPMNCMKVSISFYLI